MKLAGIDPGASGGWAIWPTREVYPMPETEPDIVAALIGSLKGADAVYIEDVGGFIGRAQPGSAMFKFGRNVGLIRGVCLSLGLRVVDVRPQRWQKALGLGVSDGDKTKWKNKLKQKAQQLWPGVHITLATSDAVLICEYGRGEYQ